MEWLVMLADIENTTGTANAAAPCAIKPPLHGMCSELACL